MKKALFLLAALLLTGAVVQAADLTVELKVGTGVTKRELIGESNSFSAEEPQLVGWCRVIGATEPIEVYHRWRRNGEDERLVELKIRSSYYRAWSFCAPQGKRGSWTLEVLDMDKKKVLATTTFETR